MPRETDGGIDDYLLVQTADAVEGLQQIQQQAASLTSVGTVIGQVAIWNGSAFVPGILIGDSNGVSVAVVSSPSFGLQVALQQALKTTSSPTFAAITISGAAAVNSLTVNSGTPVKKILSGTVAIDPGSIAAQTRGAVSFTLTGAAAGDLVVMEPPGALNTGLIYCGAIVSAANTVDVQLANITGAAIDDSSRTWRYTWIDLT